MRGGLLQFLTLAFLALSGHVVAAAEPLSCTVILDARSGDALLRDGTCDERFPPFSSFKLPLAVIGFEAGILEDAETPRWAWHAGLTAPERDRKAVDPTIWERDSVLWYSREITRLLGAEQFAQSVARLDYGNGDVSGVGGNGLTHAWLGASLRISPDEQAAFVRRLVLSQLPIDPQAQVMAASVLPDFAAGDWVVSGKTGSGWNEGADGQQIREQPLGWFVGYAQRGGEAIVFARLRVDGQRSDTNLGPLVREGFLADLPLLLP